MSGEPRVHDASAREWLRIRSADDGRWEDEVTQLADRLGVAPLSGNAPVPFIQVTTASGDRYDIGAMVHALLDRLDAASS